MLIKIRELMNYWLMIGQKFNIRYVGFFYLKDEVQLERLWGWYIDE